jgi:hypothetical protein
MFDSVSDTIGEITFLCGLKIHYSLDKVRYANEWENVSESLSLSLPLSLSLSLSLSLFLPLGWHTRLRFDPPNNITNSSRREYHSQDLLIET